MMLSSKLISLFDIQNNVGHDGDSHKSRNDSTEVVHIKEMHLSHQWLVCIKRACVLCLKWIVCVEELNNLLWDITMDRIYTIVFTCIRTCTHMAVTHKCSHMYAHMHMLIHKHSNTHTHNSKVHITKYI